jgi:hypothetical protein
MEKKGSNKFVGGGGEKVKMMFLFFLPLATKHWSLPLATKNLEPSIGRQTLEPFTSHEIGVFFHLLPFPSL